MRKIFTLISSLSISGSLLAGGLVTNNNQSAMFTRLQNRNASTSIDAVYYNPAGLTQLGNGFFASVNNQFIGQTKTITSSNPIIAGSPKDFVGKVSAPLFPGLYVAYNTGKFSFSAGFNPIGGGGGAEYAEGLPSFESMVAVLPPTLSAMDIPTTAYDADIFFEGTSVYFGYQANVAYKINDKLSIAAGVRLVSAKNTYLGHIRDISINPNYPVFGAAYTGNMVLANDFFSDGSALMSALATNATSAQTQLNTAITGGTPAATPLSALPAETATAITQLLAAAGVNAAGMNIGTAAAALGLAATGFSSTSTSLAGYAAMTQDVEVDAEETGTGFTPIISVDFRPSENLNIAVKYEFQTRLDLTTKLHNNLGGGIYTEGKVTPADMPAMLSIGAEYKPMSKLMLTGSFNTYFDQNVDYDGSTEENTDMIDRNFLEFGLGAEYGLSDKLRVSAGWVSTSTGVNSDYQSDLRYSTNTNSFGAGLGYRVTPKIDLNLGGQYTVYADDTKDYDVLKKSTWIIGVGADFFFGK